MYFLLLLSIDEYCWKNCSWFFVLSSLFVFGSLKVSLTRQSMKTTKEAGNNKEQNTKN